MRFNLLGPVSVGNGGAEPVPVQAGLPRTVLVMLLLKPNRVVSAEELAQAVWGRDRPASAAAGLRNHVSRLRRLLEPAAAARVRTVAPGYLVEVGPGELDTEVFVDACARGRLALRAGDDATACDTLTQALSLWRGSRWPTCPPGPAPTPMSCGSRRPDCWPWKGGSRRNCGWGGTRS
ncbi:hypothetical protein GXW82_31050 [Streptacidiphilus sp. 4-A2]|nr:hypothetical protein [Streptacidiphilus sp. 4-A2]